MDTEQVPGEIGTIPDLPEVIGTPREVYGPYWALVERRGKEQGRGARRDILYAALCVKLLPNRTGGNLLGPAHCDAKVKNEKKSRFVGFEPAMVS